MKSKKIIMTAAIFTLIALISGCSSQKGHETSAAENQTTEISSTELQEQENAGKNQGSMAESDSQTERTTVQNEEDDKQMTGVLDEKKSFMIIVVSDADGEAYVFPMEEESSISELQKGDKVTVSYTGDPSPDSNDVVVTGISKS